MSDIGTFSKEVLYESLKAPGQEQKGKTRKLAYDKKELISLVRDVSRAYSGFENKIRPSTIENKLFERSLTLIGGGINNELGSKTLLCDKSSSDTIINGSCQIGKNARALIPHDTKHLALLNNAWNRYALKLLRKYETVQDLAQCISKMEIIGAFMHVNSCRLNPNLNGTCGIIVESRANIWKVAQETKSSYFKLLLIPKKGSEICVQVQTGSGSDLMRGSSRYIRESPQGKVLLVLVENHRV